MISRPDPPPVTLRPPCDPPPCDDPPPCFRASAGYPCAKRGTPASRRMVHGGCRRRPPWQSHYPCASSSTWDYRALRHGSNSIHRTAGYVTRSSAGVGGRGHEASSHPDWPPKRCTVKPVWSSKSFCLKGEAPWQHQQRTRFAFGITAVLKKQHGSTPIHFQTPSSAPYTGRRETFRRGRKEMC